MEIILGQISGFGVTICIHEYVIVVIVHNTNSRHDLSFWLFFEYSLDPPDRLLTPPLINIITINFVREWIFTKI